MIEKKLLEVICSAVEYLYQQRVLPENLGLEKTRKEIDGDYTLVVFSLLKFSKKAPEITATEIGTYLMTKMPEIVRFNVIKGFLNLILSDTFWIDLLISESKQPEFGFHKQISGPPIVLEYSSPNTNKPLHLGHIRNNLLGYSLAEILKANGHHVIKVNLVNDRGIHICKSMLAYMKWGNSETPDSSGLKGDHLIGKYYVLFDKKYKEEIRGLMDKGLTEEEAEKQAPLMVEAQEILRKWEAKDHETLELWRKMNSWANEGFITTYKRLGVNFDKIYFESSTYLLGKKLVIEGLENGVLIRKEDGSVWADLRDENLDEKVLLRSDGTSVYMTQDLGTAQLRYDDFHPSSMIYVVGNEQNYHFDVLKKVLARLGKEYASRIFHLSYGMVELPEGRMKSREGTVVDADDLMDEMFFTAESTTRELGKVDELSKEEASQLFNTIGLGALKYFILKVDPKKNMLFDPRESIDFNGNTGPFIQYTYARICSLLEKAKAAGFHLKYNHGAKPESLLSREKEVIKLLAQFPEIIKEAGVELNPAVVANYSYDLAKVFNQFYQEIPVLKESDKNKIKLRVYITFMTMDVIKKSMSLLGIEVPSKM
ncbi:MAG: arginine--tRNA ligase [Bacteroidales bacterium]|nr:arginine--tRNA ligase [Bacteroidales bacterium]